MKTFALVSVSLASLALGVSTASAGIVGSNAVLITQASQKPGFTTFDVFVQFTSTTDTLNSHNGWNVSATSGSFYNADPAGADDPFGIVPDNGGLTPVASAIPGYQNWAFDTNISMDDSLTSVADAGTIINGTIISGGVTSPNAPFNAGADLMVQIAQITITNGGTFSGTAMIHHNEGSTLMNVTNVVPAPGALALLGMAGLVGGRRRRSA